MPPPKLSPTRTTRGRIDVDIRTAALVWLGTWIAGNLVGSVIIGAAGEGGGGVKPLWVSVVGALSLWVPMVGGLWYLSRRFGDGQVASDFGLSLRTSDLVGIPIGVLSQLVLLRLLYWPLEQWWPHTFGRSRVERSARDLYDTTHGGWFVALILIVVIGAPIVEELVYRGMLQGAFTRRLDETVGVVVVAGWFAIVHFQPVEYPGLFVFGLVLGFSALRTGRLGTGVLAHMAFNATGLILVAGR